VRAGDRFLFARQQARGQPQLGDRFEKGGAIAGIAAGGSGHHVHLGHALQAQDRLEPGERGEGQSHGLGRKIAAFGHALAQPRSHFLVVQHFGRAQRLAIDHQAHGVGTNIDDRARARVLAPGQAKRHGLAQSTVAPPRRSASLGTLRPLVRPRHGPKAKDWS
jgi:hypothetical protein